MCSAAHQNGCSTPGLIRLPAFLWSSSRCLNRSEPSTNLPSSTPASRHCSYTRVNPANSAPVSPTAPLRLCARLITLSLWPFTATCPKWMQGACRYAHGQGDRVMHPSQGSKSGIALRRPGRSRGTVASRGGVGRPASVPRHVPRTARKQAGVRRTTCQRQQLLQPYGCSHAMGPGPYAGPRGVISVLEAG